jgi:hypothetical protein
MSLPLHAFVTFLGVGNSSQVSHFKLDREACAYRLEALCRAERNVDPHASKARCGDTCALDTCPRVFLTSATL